jgi:hypothetical protein
MLQSQPAARLDRRNDLLVRVHFLPRLRCRGAGLRQGGVIARLIESIKAWLVGAPASSPQPGPASSPQCCARPAWVKERDLDHARGFELDLGKCTHCGAYSMYVYCVASSAGGFEPIGAADLAPMKSLPNGPELWAFMKKWVEAHVDPG